MLAKPNAARIVTSERGHTMGIHLVFVTEDGKRAGDLTPAPDDIAIDMTPAWSPDGRYVVFASSRGRRDPSRTSLWVVGTADDAAPRPLLDRVGDAVDLAPAWSPDGRRLVFASTRAGTLDLWVAEVAVERGELRVTRAAPLRKTPADEYLPAWSPSGDRIVYTEVDDTGSRIVIAPPDGSAPQRLTAGPADRGPAFSADGRVVLFSRPAPGRGDLDLWRVPIAGGEPVVFLDEPLGDEGGPVVSRDGRFVLCTSTQRQELAWATLVVAPFLEPRRWQALEDAFPISRLGVTVAPVPLDAARLSRAPAYQARREAPR